MGSESKAHDAEAEWAIDSDAMRARGLIVLVKSNQLVKKNIEAKQIKPVKARLQSFFAAKKPVLFATSGL